ncbi:MAG: NADH-quinone oxidoreductase subunit NuoN [Parvularculaceae bacterium]
MSFTETLPFISAELLLAIGAMALLIAGVFLGDGAARRISTAAVVILAAAIAIVVAAPGAHGEASLFHGAFRIDAFSTFCKVLIFGAAAFAILMSDRYLAGEQLGRFEYPVLILLASLGMSLMVSATDLISLYMGIETQSLALYILAAFNRDSRRSTEAGLKYFVLGALSSCLLLYGASLVYGFTGATTFEAIAKAAQAGDNAGLVIGLVFMISGLAFKVSAAPFHMWTPDVYEGSPTPVTAFFAAAPKLAAMALFTRVLTTSFGGAVTDWQPVIAIISVASMAVGAFSAIVQTNIKRLMAYSSIGHMGYALIGLAAGTSGGVSGVLVYMAIYIVMTIGTFAVILMMRRRGGMSESIADLSGLTRTNMPMALVLTVLMISLAGIPFSAGFFGKWFVFLAAVDAGLIWLAVVGVFASAISAFYYLRIVWFMWFDEPAPAFERDAGPTLTFAAIGSALLMFPVLPVFMRILTDFAARGGGAVLTRGAALSGAAIEVFETLDSTSAEARRRAVAGEKGPRWFVALTQTSGYGRRGRAWEQQTGDFAGTLLLANEGPAETLGQLSFVIALALFDALAEVVKEEKLALKWPNDLLLDGGKCAGILLENLGRETAIGVGVNIVTMPQEVPYKTARLADHCDAPPAPSMLAARIDAHFWRWFREWRENGFAPVRAAWLARAKGVGETITARLPGEDITGIFDGLDDTGALILRYEGGERRLAAGEVFFGAPHKRR